MRSAGIRRTPAATCRILVVRGFVQYPPGGRAARSIPQRPQQGDPGIAVEIALVDRQQFAKCLRVTDFADQPNRLLRHRHFVHGHSAQNLQRAQGG
jgi:hypothetical protein